MSSAIDTLASQNYNAGNYKEVGIVLQRSFLISWAMAVPLISTWFYARPIFDIVGVEDDVADVIQNFLRIRAISVPSTSSV
ncbi:unnamed protein product [Sphagnum jensenii]|uniref:Uncharacterized protein n=1 Tax=Sphagnum jensenii TaxID=128206 RepID=A0ABP0V698_9BRYO